MKHSTVISAEGYYAFSGRSNANSCFIEKISDAKQFLVYANYFLRGYLTIHDYVINRDGWIMVVKIKSKNTIRSNSKETDQEKEIWKLVSERMRLLISTFVRVTNRRKGRTGCLVHSSYEKLVFDSLSEALELSKKIRKQQIKMYNGRKKYRGIKTHYNISKKVAKGSIFVCSKDINKKKGEVEKLGDVFEFTRLSKLVVQNLVKFTSIFHYKAKHSKYHKKNSA